MIRLFLWIVIAGVLTWCGATVKLGNRTFFGHVSAIWNTKEAQDMKDGVVKEAGPIMDKVERGVKAGYREATEGSGSAGAGTGSGSDVVDEVTPLPDAAPARRRQR